MTDTYNLINKAQCGDKESENLLLDRNLALVHSCVRHLMRDGFEYEDLVQIGCIALIKAIRRFDTSFNVKFSTYAVPVIAGDIKRHIRDYTTVKVSRSLKEIFFEVTKLKRSMTDELMREPTINELSDRSGYGIEKLIMAFEACLPCDSLDRSISPGETDSISLADTVSMPVQDCDETDKIALKNAIMNLNERERKIILLRYFRGKTQSEVSDIIGVSQVQISRIEKKVLASLREKLV